MRGAAAAVIPPQRRRLIFEYQFVFRFVDYVAQLSQIYKLPGNYVYI